MKNKEKANKVGDEKLAAMSQVVPFEHGYAPGTMITMPAELFMASMQHAGGVAQNERSERIEITAFAIGTDAMENDPRVVRVFTTPIGMEAESVFNGLLDVHYGNIEAGLTITQGQAPKLDFGDAPVK